MGLPIKAFLTSLAMLLVTLTAQGDDPVPKRPPAASKSKAPVDTERAIADRFAKAKAEHAQKTEKLKKDVLEALQRREKALRAKKDDASIASLREQRDSFEAEMVKFPPILGEQNKAFVSRYFKARDEFEGAHVKAIGSYTEIARDDRAKELRTELQEFRNLTTQMKTYFRPAKGPTSAQPDEPVPMRKLPLLPQGDWHLRWTAAQGAANAGMVRITNQWLYHINAPNQIGTAHIDDLGRLHLKFLGHRKVAAGEAVLVKLRNGLWEGKLTLPDGTIHGFEITK